MRKVTMFIVPLLVLIIGNSHAQNNVSKNYQLPQVMIRLCNISYLTDSDKTKKDSTIQDSITAQVGWKLVWGPIELTDIFGVTYSSMYVAKDPANEDYAVVIRGTDPTSLKSWLGEDFEIHKSVPFSKFVSKAPAAAKISKGTCNGLEDLIQLKDPNHNGNVVSFFNMVQQVTKIRKLYVTGHSLGGTLTPAFYIYLCYKIFGGPAPAGITTSPYSFAGLTAGNQGFNDLLKTYLQAGNEKWRFVNPYDVAPKLWDSLDAVKNIYSADGLKFGSPESGFMDYLFKRAEGNGYTQPPGSEFPLPKLFNSCETIWLFEALSQHHSSTYISLVDSLYNSKKK